VLMTRSGLGGVVELIVGVDVSVTMLASGDGVWIWLSTASADRR
jgi:hypothetical protein